MSDGAQEIDYAFHPPTSANEASDQILSGRFLELVPDPVPSEETEYPDSVTVLAHEPAMPQIESAIAATASAEVVEVVLSEEETSSTVPATTLDREKIKEIINGLSGADYDTSIGLLLSYAWNSASDVERTLPADLIAFATDSPADWYIANSARVKRIIEERSELIDIYDATEIFEATSPFLQNASTIHSIAINRGKRDEGLRIEISARLIILEAIDERKSKLNA